ncbi:hypothetical protein [Streptomyces sp. NBC_00443]
MTEQQRAAKAYADSRGQRDPEAVQIGQHNARTGASNTSGSNPGGAR